MIWIVSKYILPKGYRGMTVFPFVFMSEAKHKEDAVFVNHERIHLRQQLELLIVFFYIWYGLEFLIRLLLVKDKKKAYHAISFEREAYQNEKDPDYLKSRSFWKFFNYM